jgi:hypothetical protein
MQTNDEEYDLRALTALSLAPASVRANWKLIRYALLELLAAEILMTFRRRSSPDGADGAAWRPTTADGTVARVRFP